MDLRNDARVIVAVVAGQEEALLEVTEEGNTLVYGSEDWRDDTAPSYGWEGTDLRQHDGSRFYGPAITVLEVDAQQAVDRLRATWPDLDGIFVQKSAKIAAIGTNGVRDVVWGIGNTAEEAIAEAREGLRQDGTPDTVELTTREISAGDVAAIEAGEVDAEDLGRR